jgi:hypothetical protein
VGTAGGSPATHGADAAGSAGAGVDPVDPASATTDDPPGDDPPRQEGAAS